MGPGATRYEVLALDLPLFLWVFHPNTLGKWSYQYTRRERIFSCKGDWVGFGRGRKMFQGKGWEIEKASNYYRRVLGDSLGWCGGLVTMRKCDKGEGWVKPGLLTI